MKTNMKLIKIFIFSFIIGFLFYFPILIPNLMRNLEKFLDEIKIDGIILSGGDDIGEEQMRDNTEKEIISYSIKKNLPIIGICRGMQVLNLNFNGKIRFNEAINHSGIKHEIQFKEKQKKLLINSYHNNLIKNKEFDPESLAKINESFHRKAIKISSFKTVSGACPMINIFCKNKLVFGL